MRISPTRVPLTYLCFLFVCISVILACSKDNDLLSELIIDQADSSSKEVTENLNNGIEEESVEETSQENIIQEGFEYRSTYFPPIHDAHVQSGTVYNQTIIRLEDGHRTSYLMFDLSPIDSIGGSILEANLQFTIDSDDGSGSITVHKGNSTDWTEDLSNGNLPEIDIQLGSITKLYELGATEEVQLKDDSIQPGLITLIMNHEDGNDLAFASKEHPSQIGSKLLVSYSAPEDAEEIIIPIEEPSQEGTETEETVDTNPIAIADATPSTGGVPLEVTFKGSNSSDDVAIVSYSWDFKDGATSTEADPVHTFTEVGEYEVVLTVTDEEGQTNLDNLTITVSEESNQAPKAVVTASATSGELPLEVSFTGSNSTDDNAVSSYSWDFKDGTTANNANPTHTFTEAGSYNVALTVKDENGLFNTKNITITVSPQQNEAPVARASASVLSGEAPLEVQFTGSNSSDDNGITSYYWNFPIDPSSSTNPTRTFNTAGTYEISLTVKDDAGLSDTTSLTITVNASSGGGGDVPQGYYVTPTGNSGNNGQSESSAWSLEHAFSTARAGDIIYVKAGNYGNKQLISRYSGSSGNPIKYIGYTNTPGDLVSNMGSTFNYGESLNANKMPLLSSTSGSGVAITLHDYNIEIENFQITGYGTGILTIDKAVNVVLRNIIVTNVGNQSNPGSYSGFGFDITGNNTLLENCFVLNAGAEAIKLYDSDNSRVNYCTVHANNPGNPTDYYFLLTGGTRNSVIENSYAERAPGLEHPGHGFDMKDLAEYNTFRNCTVRRTTFELNFSGVKNNTIENSTIYGSGTSSSQWAASFTIGNGANNNLIKNIYIKDTWAAIRLFDVDDGYVGDGGDRDLVDLGYNNTFEDITIENTDRMLNIGGGNEFSAKARNYTFKNCQVTNFDKVAVTNYGTENFVFQNCTFSNGEKLVVEAEGVYEPYSQFDVSWQNCSWNNVNFTPPN